MNLSIPRMRTRGITGKVKAFFTLILDELIIEDMRLIDGEKGVFIGFPSKQFKRKTGETSYVNLVSLAKGDSGEETPGAKKLRSEITKIAIGEYERRKHEDISEEKDDLPF